MLMNENPSRPFEESNHFSDISRRGELPEVFRGAMPKCQKNPHICFVDTRHICCNIRTMI